MERTIKELSVEGVKTRKKPNKHLVYTVKIAWSDGQVNVVSRRYCEFFDLMERLMEFFPTEAGKQDSKQRIIPTLHGKIFLISFSVMKSLERVTQFVKKLNHLPDYISQCEIVHCFFKPTYADLESTRRISVMYKKGWKKPPKDTVVKRLSISSPVFLEQYSVIADVKKEGNTGLELQEGTTVEVIEKLETGWWLVIADGEEGWVPASYLSNGDAGDGIIAMKCKPGKGEIYVSIKEHKAALQDELSFDVGVTLQVIEKNLDGWWKAIYCGCKGMVPMTYLKRVGSSQKGQAQKSTKPPPVRKQAVLGYMPSKDGAARQSEGEMSFEALEKLRSSTCKSPEEKDECSEQSRKRRLNKVKPRVHLDMKKSSAGGWVPQNISLADKADTVSSKSPRIKRFSLPRFFHSNKANNDNVFEEKENQKLPARLHELPNENASGKGSTRRKTLPDMISVKRELFRDSRAHTTGSRSSFQSLGAQVEFIHETDSTPESIQRSSSCLRFSRDSSFESTDNDDDDSDDTYDNDEGSDSDEVVTYDELCKEERQQQRAIRLRSLGKNFEEDQQSCGNSSDSGWESQESKTEDLYEAIADYKGSKDDGDVDLVEGEIVKVLQKTSSGWWLIEGGWAPSNFLEEVVEESKTEDCCQQALNPHASIEDTADLKCLEISEDIDENLSALQLNKGEKFEVLDTNNNGQYVLVRIPAKQGWIPTSCVIKTTEELPQCKN